MVEVGCGICRCLAAFGPLIAAEVVAFRCTGWVVLLELVRGRLARSRARQPTISALKWSLASPRDALMIAAVRTALYGSGLWVQRSAPVLVVGWSGGGSAPRSSRRPVTSRSAATRRCARTSSSTRRPPRWPSGSATRRRRSWRWSATSRRTRESSSSSVARVRGSRRPSWRRASRFCGCVRPGIRSPRSPPRWPRARRR